MTRLAPPLLVLFALVFAGCNNPSYVNVPGDGGDLAINDPNQFTVRKIEKAALAYLLAESRIPGDIAIRLPEGTSEATAFVIVGDLPENVFLEGQTPTDEFQLVEVREVRARGGLAEVDTFRPGNLRAREFVTVYLAWDFFDGWIAERSRVWGFNAEDVDPNLLVAPGAGSAEPKFEEVEPPQDQPEAAE